MHDGWDDEQFLAALREAMRARQAVPSWFVETGKNAYAWLNIDAELAQLTYDSDSERNRTATVRPEAAAVRSEADAAAVRSEADAAAVRSEADAAAVRSEADAAAMRSEADAAAVRSEADAAAVRSEAASIRTLTFTSEHLSIQLEVDESALLGQVIPPQAGTLEIHTTAGVTSAPVDEIGCFAVDPIPPSPFRIRCRTDDGTDVLTGWVTL